MDSNILLESLTQNTKILLKDDFYYGEFKKASDDKIHMVITETMLNGLQKEPQVAITQNLVPQLTDGGLLIPKDIQLTINLVDYQTKMKRLFNTSSTQESFFKEVSPLINVNQKNCNNFEMYKNIEVTLPQAVEERFDDVCLFTTIQVYGDHVIGYNECSLTLPITYKELTPSDLINQKVMFDYVFGKQHKFEYRLI